MAGSPLDQFKVKPLVDLSIGGYDISYTNSSLMLTIVAALVVLFFTLGLRGNSLIPNKFQALIELLYEFISNMVRDNVGNAGKKFFPFVFSIFIIILGCNLIGMLPYSFTVTSHIAVNFAFALFCFLIINIYGLIKHGTHFFSLFVPKGVPIFIVPIISVIEVISYLIRPFTLAIRLSAAMTAGHIVMKVFAGFVISLGTLSAGLGGLEIIFGAIPLAFSSALVALELLVAFLQAFIFSILICIYLNDAVNLH
jgi:F-type H+-transporting ATPase subunit a